MTNASALGWEDEELLRHMDWVRRLAGSLVSDAASADDLTQAVVDKALQHGPVAASKQRGWLASTLRNTLWNERRNAAARRDRESRTSRSEVVDERPEDVLIRAERHQLLVGEVLALPPAQREALLLRYFEDLGPGEIAKRVGAPVETVRTRLHRGQAKLRERLEGRYGQGWVAALGPLVRAIPTAQKTQAVASVAQITALAAAAAVVMLLGWGGWALISDRTEPVASIPRLADPTDPAPATRSVIASPSAESRREFAGGDGTAPASAPSENALAAADVPRTGPTTLLRAVDSQGRAAAGIGFWSGQTSGRTDSLGHVELDGLLTDVSARAGAMVIGTRYLLLSEDRAELDVMVADGRDVDIEVVTPAGRPVEGADVSYGVLVASLPTFEGHLGEAGPRRRAIGSTDSMGRVSSITLPWLAETRVTAQLRGADGGFGARATVRLGDAGLETDLVRIVVDPAEVPTPFHIRGQVFDVDGRPSAGARVTFPGCAPAKSAADGAFTLELRGDRWPFTWTEEQFARRQPLLMASAYRSQPAVDRELATSLRARPGDRDGIVLRLGAPTLEIHGRIVDDAGEPREGVRVSLVDPTREDQGAPGSAERWAAGGRPVMSDNADTITDDEGRFVLRGLGDREYRLAAIDLETSISVWTDAVPAGTRDLDVVLRRDALIPLLSGQVVDHDGSAIPGLLVTLERPVVPAVVPFDPSSRAFHATKITDARTDSQGRFELRDVPRDHVQLAVGESEPTVIGAPFPAEGAALRIRHDELRRVRVAGPSTKGLFGEFLDENDRPVRTLRLPEREALDAPFALDPDDVLEVSGDARTLVTFRDEGGQRREVSRLGITLAPRRLNVLRP